MVVATNVHIISVQYNGDTNHEKRRMEILRLGRRYIIDVLALFSILQVMLFVNVLFVSHPEDKEQYMKSSKEFIHISSTNLFTSTDSQRHSSTPYVHIFKNKRSYLNKATTQGGPNMNPEKGTSLDISTTLPLCPCVSPYLRGKIEVNMTVQLWTWKEIEQNLPKVDSGGKYSPHECRSRHKVAIIVPIRNRWSTLKIFVYHMHSFLQRQQLEYRIYAIELDGVIKFNRALLMNIAFLESNKMADYGCHVYHDVDFVPMNDNNLYSCPDVPKHLNSEPIGKFKKNRIPYPKFFGGVSILSREQFELVNGFPNIYFGWGGEDDDLYRRIRFKNMAITRPIPEIGKYFHIPHVKEKKNHRNEKLLETAHKRFGTDGLNTVKYSVLEKQERALFTYIKVTVNRTQIEEVINNNG